MEQNIFICNLNNTIIRLIYKYKKHVNTYIIKTDSIMWDIMEQILPNWKLQYTSLWNYMERLIKKYKLVEYNKIIENNNYILYDYNNYLEILTNIIVYIINYVVK